MVDSTEEYMINKKTSFSKHRRKKRARRAEGESRGIRKIVRDQRVSLRRGLISAPVTPRLIPGVGDQATVSGINLG